ncbi:MAG: ATP-binding protein [Treponema sp.]|nr:ATP-binding protein [Treponema sp.]
MPTERSGSRNKRVLFLKLLFVTLAFALMVLSSSYFVQDMLKTHLSKDADALLTQTKLRIESELVEAQTALNIVSSTVRSMVMQGEPSDAVYRHLRNVHAEMDKKKAGFIFNGFFTYFEAFGGEYFHSEGRIEKNFDPADRPWYEAAAREDEEMIVTPIYYSSRTNQYDITFVHRILNDEGSFLGIVCLNVPLQYISNYIMEMHIAQGGYGVLLSGDLDVIVHLNPDFIGKPARQISPGFSMVSHELEFGNDFFEREFENYLGQWIVASTMRLDNGWVLILITPKTAYYEQMQNMVFIIGSLGAAFAAVLIVILIRIDIAKNKTDEQNRQKSALLINMEKLRDADERTHIMLNATPLGCKLWDKDLNVIECNQEAVNLFGLRDKQEFISEFFKLSPEYQPDGKLSEEKAVELVKKAFAEGYCRFEWMHQKLNGELIPTEIILVRVKHKEDFAVAGYIRDLREYKQMMQNIHNSAVQLEAAVKEAQEASMAKSKFLATMSHEIRTPMNVILGVTESYLENEKLSHNIREGYEKIYNSADLLLHIINDILDLSKIEAGKLELSTAKYDIMSLINDAAHLNALKFQHKPIEFNLHVDENIPVELIGDELRIKQILNNLLTNAFKYTDSGNVKLSFSIEPDTQSGRIIFVLQVSDTGQGMTPEQVEKLFDEYTRFNLESNRKTIGTGLGMAITRNLIILMNGTLSVESEPGKGTSVTVKIPQVAESSVILGKKAAENLQNFVFKNAMQKNKKIARDLMPYGKVLVVDDMASNLDVAKLLLKPYLLHIETAKSGFDAINLIKNGKEYDVIFMDHMMPEMDGIEAAKLIRKFGYKHPIIALTANAVVGQQEIFLANGFDAYISKPIDRRQLNDALNKFIRDKTRILPK